MTSMVGQPGQEMEMKQYMRGCLGASEACLPGCSDQAIQGAPEGTPPTNVCTYCCEGELCNAADIKTTAEGQAPPPVEGSRKCYQCDQVKSDATEGSCASDDFNGEGAQQVDCDNKCFVSIVEPPLISCEFLVILPV